MSRNHHRIAGPRWQATRRAVFARDGYRCVRCGKAGRLECDHRIPIDRDPDQDPYAVDGCQSLCRGCHIQKSRAERLETERRRPIAPGVAAWRSLVAELLSKEAA